jgi:hypothetical protein
MKQLLINYAKDGKFKSVKVAGTDAANIKSTVASIKAVSNKLEFMSSEYNHMGVKTFTKKPDQIVILDAAFDATMDVEVLASAFNMDKVQFLGQRVLIDDFADLSGVVCAIVDRDFFMVFDNMINFSEIYNGQGLYWNYWYHIWKTFSVSPFANAVLFTTGTPAITSVTMAPTTYAIVGSKGGVCQFLTTVVATGYADDDVVVTSTALPTGCVLTKDILYVPAGTEAGEITITAKSVTDETKTATCVVTIS